MGSLMKCEKFINDSASLGSECGRQDYMVLVEAVLNTRVSLPQSAHNKYVYLGIKC